MAAHDGARPATVSHAAPRSPTSEPRRFLIVPWQLTRAHCFPRSATIVPRSAPGVNFTSPHPCPPSSPLVPWWFPCHSLAFLARSLSVPYSYFSDAPCHTQPYLALPPIGPRLDPHCTQMPTMPHDCTLASPRLCFGLTSLSPYLSPMLCLRALVPRLVPGLSLNRPLTVP